MVSIRNERDSSLMAIISIQKGILKDFVKERNALFVSLDKGRILDFCRKYSVPVPEDETIFWAGVHKAITGMIHIDRQTRIESAKWLLKNGFTRHYIDDITEQEAAEIESGKSQTGDSYDGNSGTHKG